MTMIRTLLLGKRFWIMGATVFAVCATGVGIALATHVPQVDPATVPPGFLATHNDVLNQGNLESIAGRRRIQVFVQHVQVAPNGALPWHTHPGPVVVAVVRGTLIYEFAAKGECRQKTYAAGTGFVEEGFGHVHRAIAGPEGFDSYATYLVPRLAATQTIPAEPPKACVT
jgi:quercetin dioxygenase-like cupin family protein